MKHYRYDKIRQYAKYGKRNVSLSTDEQRTLFKYAQRKGYLVEKNDAARNAKTGLHYEVVHYFDEERLRTKMYAEKRRTQRDAERRVAALKKAISEVLHADYIDSFCTTSDIGSIKIDGNTFSNFYGNGTNCAEVCAVDFDTFKVADKITRRQVYNVKEPLTIVKFEEPKTINVSLSDVDASAGVKTIDNVCGFAIWARKIKIFTPKQKE